jgi:type VI secretion system protein ImpF
VEQAVKIMVAHRKDRLNAPLMFAFRSAHAARDAKQRVNLRDEAGERIIAGRRTAARTPISELTLRREVAHDLEILMNTIALESSEDLSGAEAVRKSILNFGCPDIAHRTIDEHSAGDIKGEIETVLRNFEPRLVAGSIRASRDTGVNPDDLKVRFVVRAELRSEPVNVPVEFIADVELDSGKVALQRL